MRFQRIRIDHFGRIAGLDTGEDALPSLVVVHGPNEAGKSSLFGFLTALVYGIYPTSRETNPYTPWSGEDIDGRAELLLDDGSVWTVHRRLLSSPWGRLERQDGSEDLGNHTLPVAEHVPRELYEAVYALTLEELAGLEGESWQAVQDRLLGALGATDVKPAREVWQELEASAKSLWRPTERGKPRAKELAARLAKLRTRRRDAAARDRTVREKDRLLAEVRQELQEARLERSRLKERLERARVLVPVRKRLDRIRELEAESGDPEELDGIPDEPARELEELRAAVEAVEAEVEELRSRRDEAVHTIESQSPGDRSLLEQEGRIERLLARQGKLEGATGDIARLERELDERELELATRAGEILTTPWQEVDLAELNGIPMDRLRERIRRYRTARDDRRVLRTALERERSRPERAAPRMAPGVVLLALALIAVTLFGAGIARSDAFLAGAGVALLILAAVIHLRNRTEARAGQSDGKELEEARKAEEEARQRVLELLDGLALHPAVEEEPTLELPTGLERLRDLVQGHEACARALEQARSEVHDARGELDALEGELDLDAELPDEPEVATALLRRELDAARKRQVDVRDAKRERDRIDQEIQRRSEVLDERRSRLGALEEKLAGLGGGDVERGIRRARSRLDADEEARRIRKELEREHPDLDGLERRIESAREGDAPLDVDEESEAAAHAAVEELSREIEEMESRVGELKKEVEHLLKEETPDEVEGAIQAVEEEIARVETERDRHYLLARLVREADRRFRDAHQPDLLRRAGQHLSTITGGRYTRLDPAVRDGKDTFVLEGPGAPYPLEVDDPLSTGTKEQVYLSLRLAIVDHLDEGAETLPLFMDEALVNWDRRRRGRGLDLLVEASGHRQIFVFTCHAPLVAEMEERGARRIDLPGPSAEPSP